MGVWSWRWRFGHPQGRASRLRWDDLFDRHSTLQLFWESLIDSYAFDWLGAQVEASAGKPGEEIKFQAELKKISRRVAVHSWEAFAPPGEGRDFRLQSRSCSGAALVWDDRTVLHLQVFPRQPGKQAPSPYRPRIHRPYGRPPAA
jgi:hypothetical protein